MKMVKMPAALAALSLLVNGAEVCVASPTLYRMPLSVGHVPTQWFDHDTATSNFLRYDGKTQYGGVGYNTHDGTDIKSTMGYGIWAGADGTVYSTVNNCLDKGEPFYDATCGYSYGNNVRLVHPDGKATIYTHMKRGTVAVANNQSVLCSRLLGNVEVSGKTTEEHLHFELRSTSSLSSYLKIDQFSGPYSNNYVSYWVNQNGRNPATQCQ